MSKKRESTRPRESELTWEFHKFKIRFFVRMLVTALLALIGGWLCLYFVIDGILQQPFSDFFIGLPIVCLVPVSAMLLIFIICIFKEESGSGLLAVLSY